MIRLTWQKQNKRHLVTYITRKSDITLGMTGNFKGKWLTSSVQFASIYSSFLIHKNYFLSGNRNIQGTDNFVWTICDVTASVSFLDYPKFVFQFLSSLWCVGNGDRVKAYICRSKYYLLYSFHQRMKMSLHLLTLH